MTCDIMQMPQKKAGVIILAAAGVLVLALGFWSISYKIRAPFFLKAVDKNLLSNNAVPDLTKDTDGDGLTDWEETNIYHTSPYLWSTSSDGISDGDKVRRGLDPLCNYNTLISIDGQPCGPNAGQSAPSTGNFSTSSAPGLPGLTPNFTSAAPSPNVTTVLPANLTVSQIREALKQGGVSEADLKKLDDKTIMELYHQAAAQAANSGQ